jgi:hypothetical protein
MYANKLSGHGSYSIYFDFMPYKTKANQQVKNRFKSIYYF